MADLPRKHSSHKQNKKAAYSGNHQRSWLWGHHAVLETLQAGRWPVVELYATREAFEQFRELLLSQTSAGVPVDIVSSTRLQELCKSADHQGLVARLGKYPYQSLDKFVSQLRATLEKPTTPACGDSTGAATSLPLIVICDRIQDAFNLGAILRCCDGTSVAGVIVGENHQAEVTPHVARSSSGAVNYVPISKTHDLLTAARTLKSLGFQLCAADGNAPANVWDADLSGLNALVIGSEAEGINRELLELCDCRVGIPMQGKVTSLNAAVAAGILLYEIRRQQRS